MISSSQKSSTLNPKVYIIKEGFATGKVFTHIKRLPKSYLKFLLERGVCSAS
jgi:hypothetical protein